MSDLRWQTTRLAGLRRFALAITFLNVLGHTLLGFEQSWSQPLVAILAGYSIELGLQWLEGWSTGRRVLATDWRSLIDSLLPAHITSLAIAMLLYPNQRLMPIVFAVCVALASKALLRVATDCGRRHVLNPSNFGIAVTLICFPSVGISPPYHFTENLVGWGDWLLPGLIVCTGSIINARFTRRLPLVLAWVAAFAAQAVARAWWFDTPVLAGLAPMTGVAFVLFTFYMVTDPATTPFQPRAQVCFGAAVAAAYAGLMMLHVVFGFFFALVIVSVLRGLILQVQFVLKAKAQPAQPSPSPAVPTGLRGLESQPANWGAP